MLDSSRTALMVAAYRARATAQKDAICNDPWAAALAGDTGHEIARTYDAVYPHMELWIAVRTAFIDERVAQASELSQVVLLGAGFDTRAVRLARPGVRFFEVDHPDTQREKRARLQDLAGYPAAAASYVSCDFEREDFVDRLVASGFRTDAAALFVWEGVTPYLTEAAVRGTLRRIAGATHADSVVIFDHVRKKIVAGAAREKDLESRAFVEGLGEPLRFGIDYPLPLLYEEGFGSVRSMTFDEICLHTTGTYDRAREFRFQGLVIASRAAHKLVA